MKPILFGVTVYGDAYLDFFLRYTLPSLMADGNWPVLEHIILHIHTDAKGWARLTHDLNTPNNVSIRVHIDVTNEDKYEQLGRHQNQDLREAKKIGANFHLLMPDFIYSENCFAGVLKAVAKGHKAIVRLVMSTVAETILPELKRPRSAIDLATLAFQNIHPGIRNWLITEKGYPKTHVIAWVGKDTIRMCSPHCSPVYIANEAIHLTDSQSTLDAILDKVIIGDIYCPKPEDGIVIIEVSPLDSRKPQYECVSLEGFCHGFKWDTKNSPRQLAIFMEETVDAIHPQTNCWNEQDIARIKETVHNAILANMEK
jgi:hypothetical protein